MIKDQVLAILLQTDNCISGEKISAELGVTRAAVNAAVQALRKEGYEISSSTKKGYTLKKSPGNMCPGELIVRLGKERAEKIICFETIDSTNTYLKQLAQEGAEAGTVVIASEQTAGRGRQGRSFESPKGEGLYLSMLFKPQCKLSDAAQFTAWAAVAAMRAVKSAAGIDCGIKWVNDLILDGKKLAGILTELSIEAESGEIQYLVAGIGINVSQKSFKGELSNKAISLSMSTGKKASICDLAAELIKELDKVAEEFPERKAEYREAYRSACVTLNKEVSYEKNGETFYGRALMIDEDFGLTVLRSDFKEEHLFSGEVSIRSAY
ncbi:MAG: biotin--[acetyl-CoA-carboxylase] ligase [Parasporobacterium sp.]|nr:biotin--[acetyl-CoA-carboxylase] ligase [Parasporobacterium sp.]